MSLPDKVVNALSDPAYHRQVDDIEVVLGQLDVTPSSEFTEFYRKYIGGVILWELSLLTLLTMNAISRLLQYNVGHSIDFPNECLC